MAVAASGLDPGMVATRLRRTFAGTPGMLRGGMAACLLGVALFAWLATNSVGDRRDALRSARAAASQVVLVQQVHTALVEADSLATNAFLVGGLEPSVQREGYQEGLATASRALATAAANAAAADVAVLEDATAALTNYTGLIEAARANNRQGFPVGAAYLRQASQLLRSEVLPVLEAVSAASQERVDDAYDRSGDARWGLWVAAVVALAALVLFQLMLSSATRRTLNVPLLAATVLLLVGLVWGGSSMASAASDASSARDGAYRTTTSLAQSRIDAFAAKSAESLTLINRGNGAANEEEWQVQYASSLAELEQSRFRDTDLVDLLESYGAIHTQIRELDDGGDWDGAVAMATGFDEGTANAAFGAFDEESAALLGNAAADLDNRLDDATSPLGSLRTVLLVLSLLAAAGVAIGFTQRLREYR